MSGNLSFTQSRKGRPHDGIWEIVTDYDICPHRHFQSFLYTSRLSTIRLLLDFMLRSSSKEQVCIYFNILVASLAIPMYYFLYHS